MTDWIDVKHRCRIPRAQDVIDTKANSGSVWKCPDCAVEWILSVTGQQGSFTNVDTGLVRQVGFVS